MALGILKAFEAIRLFFNVSVWHYSTVSKVQASVPKDRVMDNRMALVVPSDYLCAYGVSQKSFAFSVPFLKSHWCQSDLTWPLSPENLIKSVDDAKNESKEVGIDFFDRVLSRSYNKVVGPCFGFLALFCSHNWRHLTSSLQVDWIEQSNDSRS